MFLNGNITATKFVHSMAKISMITYLRLVPAELNFSRKPSFFFTKYDFQRQNGPK